MLTLTVQRSAVVVDWMWTISVDRVLDAPPDPLNWANTVRDE